MLSKHIYIYIYIYICIIQTISYVLIVAIVIN